MDHLTIPKQVANSDTSDDDKDEQEPRKDILKIISDTLKEGMKLKSTCTVKITTQLTAVAEYVKLHARWARVHTLPGRFVRMNATFFAITICHLPKSTAKGANTFCWTTMMFSKRFKFISQLRNLGQSHLSSYVNM